MATETGRRTKRSATTRAHDASCQSMAQSNMPTATTAAPSPIRSSCSLKLSTAWAMKAGACFGSVATWSACDASGSAWASAAISAERWRRLANWLSCETARAGAAVGKADEAEREKVVEPRRFLVRAAQVEHELADGGAHQGADADARRDAPGHIDRLPAPAGAAEIVQAEQAEAEQHEGKRRAVVEPGLASQGEAQAVAVAGLGHLHVGGEHRVGRREDAAEEDGGAHREAEHGHAEGRDEGDRDEHRDDGQTKRRPPAAVAEAGAHLQPRREKRKQDDDLGQYLDRRRVRER